jgi:hypothetical protein
MAIANVPIGVADRSFLAGNSSIQSAFQIAMTRTLPRSNLHSTQLVRTLLDLDAASLSAPPADLGQALGQWLTFVDANSLSELKFEYAGQTPTGAATGNGTAIEKEFSKLRSSLEADIIQSAETGANGSRLSLPVPHAQQTTDDSSSYAPYRRYIQAQQQNMEARVRQIRATVRDRVSRATPGLKQLVDLDTTFERILGEREAARLANIPAILEKRFKQLLGKHQQSLAEQEAPDSVELWLRPDGWLNCFHKELQAVLLAELDLRLQTTVGLIEACNKQLTQQA